jgi:hypothetical protein
VLDPRTKSVPPVGEPIPDDASIEQLRCHTREAIEKARASLKEVKRLTELRDTRAQASLASATEDRKEAKRFTELLDKAVRATIPDASSPDTRQCTGNRRGEELKRRQSSADTRQREVLEELQRDVDREDMGVMGYYPSSREDSEQLRIMKKHHLEFTMDVVQ